MLITEINSTFDNRFDRFDYFSIHRASLVKMNVQGKLIRLSQWRALPELQVAMLIKEINQSIGNHDNSFNHFGFHNASSVKMNVQGKLIRLSQWRALLELLSDLDGRRYGDKHNRNYRVHIRSFAEVQVSGRLIRPSQWRALLELLSNLNGRRHGDEYNRNCRMHSPLLC